MKWIEGGICAAKGFKASGVGREFGPEGLAQYTELKSVYLGEPAAGADN